MKTVERIEIKCNECNNEWELNVKEKKEFIYICPKCKSQLITVTRYERYRKEESEEKIEIIPDTTIEKEKKIEPVPTVTLQSSKPKPNLFSKIFGNLGGVPTRTFTLPEQTSNQEEENKETKEVLPTNNSI